MFAWRNSLLGRRTHSARDRALSNEKNGQDRCWPATLHLNCFSVAEAQAGLEFESDRRSLEGIPYHDSKATGNRPRATEEKAGVIQVLFVPRYEARLTPAALARTAVTVNPTPGCIE
jgi:hypothetical protein